FRPTPPGQPPDQPPPHPADADGDHGGPGHAGHATGYPQLLCMAATCLGPGQPRRSTIVALAIPPPSHIVCRPYRPPERSSSWSSVVISRAPEHPRGWPSAIDPPLTLTRSISGCSSRPPASTTDASASLISTWSI